MQIHFLLTQDLDSPSGLGRYWPLAKELAKYGHKVRISALHSNYNELAQNKYSTEGVDIAYVSQMHVKKTGSKKSYYPVFQLLLILLRATIQLTHCALVTPSDILYIGKPHPMNGMAAIAAKILKRSKIYLDCDDYELGINRMNQKWQIFVLNIFDRWLPRLADLITTNTRFNFDRLCSMNIPSQKIYYLPNGVDLDRFLQPKAIESLALKKRLNLEGKAVISYIGTIGLTSHPIELLLKAFKIVNQEMPKTRLLLVGGGEDLQEIQNWIKTLGIQLDVVICGRVSPNIVPLYYSISDLTIDPVYDDLTARGRSPLKIYESLSLGIPVITGDVGDRKEILEGDRFGNLVRPGDETALADGIINLLNDPVRREDIKVQAYEQRQKWSWSHLVENAQYLQK